MDKKRKKFINPYNEHERLFSDTGLKLGKILWYMLSSAQEIKRRTYIIQPNGEVSRELTEFAKELGKDEIFWWIYKKKTDVEELQIEVEQTLLSLQNLKESANKLEFYGIQTYADLVTTLANFTEAHEAQIDDLYEFIIWLHKKDPLCPAILFTYRVWGSTRLADRWLELDTANIDDESIEVIRRLTETAYGLFQRFDYTLSSVIRDISYEIYESDPENYRAQEIPEDSVVPRTAHKVLKEFTILFEELRDSLRNIELDIEKYLAEKNLLKSESFWKDFIIKSKTPGRTESVLWDFKESLEMWHVLGPQRTKKQIDLCKLVAAFANREGGAIIIGVTNDTRDIVGVTDLENKMKSISEAIHRWLDYPRKDTIVHLQPIPFDHNGQVSMCLVVAVAQTADVARVKGDSNEYYYPDRDQTGVAYREPKELETRKMHLKAEDNFGFMKKLAAFIYDK